ncbi:MAG TPA: hypothetical protein VK961_11910 [Chthoniobacter sp.]|nr:hypothetical protein [Chthoniobacter sp.]
MPITKGNRAIAALVHVTIVVLVDLVPAAAAARPRLGAMATVAAPAPAARAGIARLGIAPVARVPVLVEDARKVVATAARVRPIAAHVIVTTLARLARRRGPLPRS